MTRHRAKSFRSRKTRGVKGRQRRSTNRNRRIRPASAHRERTSGERNYQPEFNASEIWYEPSDDPRCEIRYVEYAPGDGYVHPVSIRDIKKRLASVPRAVSAECGSDSTESNDAQTHVVSVLWHAVGHNRLSVSD